MPLKAAVGKKAQAISSVPQYDLWNNEKWLKLSWPAAEVIRRGCSITQDRVLPYKAVVRVEKAGVAEAAKKIPVTVIEQVSNASRTEELPVEE